MRWLKDNIINLIALIPLVVGAVVVFLAWVQQIPWYLIALSAIAAIAIVFFIINQIHTWRERHKKGLSKYSDKEIESTIREWIDIPMFTIKRTDVDESKTYFTFTVIDTEDRQFHIARNRKSPHYIGIFTAMSLDSKPEMSVELTEEDIKKLVAKLSLEMLRLGCSYEFDFKEKGFILTLHNSVLIEDSLTDVAFRNECGFLARAWSLAMGIIGLTLQELGVNVPTFRKRDS